MWPGLPGIKRKKKAKHYSWGTSCIPGKQNRPRWWSCLLCQKYMPAPSKVTNLPSFSHFINTKIFLKCQIFYVELFTQALKYIIIFIIMIYNMIPILLFTLYCNCIHVIQVFRPSCSIYMNFGSFLNILPCWPQQYTKWFNIGAG